MKKTDSPTRLAGRKATSGSAMLSDLAWKTIADSLELSHRQLQIVREVFDDSTEQAIADNLGISQHTVHTHLERIHRKLDIHDRVELVLTILSEFLRLSADAESTLPPVCPRLDAGDCPLRNPLKGQ